MADPPIVEPMSESTVATHVSINHVSPAPTDDEVVAIMAGVEALWPKPVVVVDTAPPRSTASVSYTHLTLPTNRVAGGCRGGRGR